MQVFYMLAGQYTIMSHASIFGNMGGVFIVLYRSIKREPVHIYEYLGLFIALSGSSIAMSDKAVSKVDPSNQRIFFGDICGILSSLSAAYYFEKNTEFVR
jgi:drug/metabolite transporter (DMT)-like permease